MSTKRDALTLLSEGRDLLQASVNVEGAIACFEEVIALDPGHMTLTSAYMNRLGALRKLGRHQEADADRARWEAVYAAANRRKAISDRERPDSEVQAGKEATASAYIERIERLRQANDKLAQGKQLLQEEAFEGALACFDEVIGSAPSQAIWGKAHQHRSEVLWKLGRTAEAQASERVAESTAPRLPSETFNPPQREEGGGGVHMLIGAVIFLGGLIATIATYSSAAPGETYTVFYGAMIVGAIEFVVGMSK